MTGTATSAARPALAAVDWGTSSFRLWTYDSAGGLMAERRSGEGMSTLQPAEFEGVLCAHLAAAGSAPRKPEDPLPVIICGMAGARQGWREAGYVDVPAQVDAVADAALRVAVDGLDVRILPGLAQRDPSAADVMRGEETQLLGMLLNDRHLTATVVMPGTHSKWVTLRDGRVDRFRTVMTGELFALLSRQSILKHAIGDTLPATAADAETFREGLRSAREAKGAVIGRLFALRAGSLLLGISGSKPADKLSGLLIGAELAEGLAAAEPAPIRLVASGRLGELYRAAFEEFGREVTVIDADRLVIDGLTFAAGRIWPRLLGPASVRNQGH